MSRRWRDMRADMFSVSHYLMGVRRAIQERLAATCMEGANEEAIEKERERRL
jgi:hypothetical protein